MTNFRTYNFTFTSTTKYYFLFRSLYVPRSYFMKQDKSEHIPAMQTPSYYPSCWLWRLLRGPLLKKSAKSEISERILTCCPPLNTLEVLSVSQMSSWSLYPSSHRVLLHSEGFSSLSAPVTGVMEVLMEARPPLLSVFSSNLATYSLPYLLWFYDLIVSAIASACLQHTQCYLPQYDIGDYLVITFWERSLLKIFFLFFPMCECTLSQLDLKDDVEWQLYLFHGPEI